MGSDCQRRSAQRSNEEANDRPRGEQIGDSRFTLPKLPTPSVDPNSYCPILTTFEPGAV